MQVKVRTDSLLAMLPKPCRRKHIARQPGRRERVQRKTKLDTDRRQEGKTQAMQASQTSQTAKDRQKMNGGMDGSSAQTQTSSHVQ